MASQLKLSGSSDLTTDISPSKNLMIDCEIGSQKRLGTKGKDGKQENVAIVDANQ
jgi:hypothetical protein